MKYFLLAIILGFVLRLTATLGISYYAKKCKTDSEMREYYGFHFSIGSFIVGTLLKYVGITLVFAHLVNKYIIS